MQEQNFADEIYKLFKSKRRTALRCNDLIDAYKKQYGRQLNTTELRELPFIQFERNGGNNNMIYLVVELDDCCNKCKFRYCKLLHSVDHTDKFILIYQNKNNQNKSNDNNKLSRIERPNIRLIQRVKDILNESNSNPKQVTLKDMKRRHNQKFPQFKSHEPTSHGIAIRFKSTFHIGYHDHTGDHLITFKHDQNHQNLNNSYKNKNRNGGYHSININNSYNKKNSNVIINSKKSHQSPWQKKTKPKIQSNNNNNNNDNNTITNTVTILNTNRITLNSHKHNKNISNTTIPTTTTTTTTNNNNNNNNRSNNISIAPQPNQSPPSIANESQLSSSSNTNTNIDIDDIEEIISLHPPYIITPHVADIIKQLYNDTSIQTTLKQRYNYRLNICDSIEYFVNKIDEIGVHGYIPTFDDSIRVHSQTNGYSIFKFVKNIDNYGKYMFEMADIGGAQSERRKWWHPKLLLDPDLNTIIYVVDISEYNMVLFDNKHDIGRISVSDDRTNKLMDSINTFRQLIESMNETFENKSIILLFNKYDLFKDKIKTIPISVTFDVSNDINPNNPDDVIRFIACQFSNVFKQCRITLKYPLQIIRTVGIDTNSIKAMFDTILSKIIVKCINSKNKNENETFKAEMDGFDAPLISVPTLVNHPYSTPAIHHNLPKLKVRSQNHSLPIFTETHSLPIFTESSDAKKIVFTESTDI